MPPELEKIRDEVHGLGKEIAGLRPLVHEIHGNMPRITVALEVLARVSEKLESNADDHKRLHFRITDVEKEHEHLHARHDDLEKRFEKLKDEHIVCTTTQRIERRAERAGLWAKIKTKIEEKSIELMVGASLLFVAWIVLSHLRSYPPLIQAAKSAGG